MHLARIPLLSLPLLLGTPSAPAMRRELPNADPNDNQVPAGTCVGDMLTLRLIATRAAWRIHGDVEDALDVLAFAEEGKVPTRGRFARGAGRTAEVRLESPGRTDLSSRVRSAPETRSRNG